MKKKVSFLFENKKICGFLYLPESPPASPEKKEKNLFPAVIFVHGFGGGAHEIKNMVMCDALAKEGFVAFQFDFYDWPNKLSEIPIEDMTVSLQLEILRKAVDFMSSLPEIDAERIALAGHSVGGMTALLYTPTDPRIKALVAQSPASVFDEMPATEKQFRAEWKRQGFRIFDIGGKEMKVNFTYLKDGLKFNVYSTAEKILCPVLVYHGNEDEMIPLAQSLELKKHLKLSDEFVIIEDADHCYKKNNTLSQTTELLVQFIKKYLR